MEEIVSINGNMERATAIRAALIDRTRILETIGNDLLNGIGEDSDLKDATKSAKEFAADVEALRDVCKRAIRRELEESGLAIIVKQIDSRLMTYSTRAEEGESYARLAALKKSIDSAIKQEAKRREGDDERFDFCFVVGATYDGYKKLVADLKKRGIDSASTRIDSAKQRHRINAIFGGAVFVEKDN